MPSLWDGWPHYVVIVAVGCANYWVVSPVVGMIAPLWRSVVGRALLTVSLVWLVATVAAPGISLRLQAGGHALAASLLVVIQLVLAWRAGVVVRRWLPWGLWEGTLGHLRPEHVRDAELRSWALDPGTRNWIRQALLVGGDRYSRGQWDDLIPRPPLAAVMRLRTPPAWATPESALLDQEFLASVLRQARALKDHGEQTRDLAGGSLLTAQAGRVFLATRARERAIRNFLTPLWWKSIRKPLPRRVEADLAELAIQARQVQQENPKDSAEAEGVLEAMRIAEEVLGWKPGAS